MAGLKKKKKERGSSPNVVLVVFLVMFILVNIGLGVWLYYAIDEKSDAKRKQVAAEKDSNLKKTDAAYYSMLAYDLRTMQGDPLSADDEEKKGKEAMILDREEFMKDSPKFANVPNDKVSFKKYLLSMREKLGTAPNSLDYKSSIEEQIKGLQEEVRDLKGKYTDELAKNKRMETFSAKITKTNDGFHQGITDLIKKENDKIFQETKAQSDAFKNVTIQNAKLTADLDDKQKEFEQSKTDFDMLVNGLKRKLKIAEAERNELANGNNPGGGGGGGGGNKSGEPFPLLLDITMGKPLWDAPVGKIVRVDLDLRQVAINLGSSHGIQREVTFNIFGAGAGGRGEKQLKGTIEVIKVLDTSTSLCRITSLYDAEGREIAINAQSRFQLSREAEAPLREGDLLYNLFWGTRVAVSGYVSITGEESNNPAEQNRQMEDFMYMLKRNGMHVDAFVDLRDGQMRGRITAKTRYLIRGKDLIVPKAKAPDDEKDKEKDGGKDMQPGGGRNETVNRASAALRKEAIERGLLLISPENFAAVIGYRQARSANSPAITTFRPGLPYAGEAPAPAPRPKEAP